MGRPSWLGVLVLVSACSSATGGTTGGTGADTCTLDRDCISDECRIGVGRCACSADGDCASACNAVTGVCGASLFSDGTPCGTNPECASGFCDAVAGACAPRKSEGMACTLNTECASGVCGQSKPNSPCLYAGSSCTCVVPRAVGGPCAADDECTSAWCDLRSGVCISGPQPDGAPCTRDKDCKSGVCADAYGLCGPRPPGSECDRAQDCASGSCDSGCVSYTDGCDGTICWTCPTWGSCTSLLPGGQPCSGDAQCQSGSCAGGTCASP